MPTFPQKSSASLAHIFYIVFIVSLGSIAVLLFLQTRSLNTDKQTLSDLINQTQTELTETQQELSKTKELYDNCLQNWPTSLGKNMVPFSAEGFGLTAPVFQSYEYSDELLDKCGVKYTERKILLGEKNGYPRFIVTVYEVFEEPELKELEISDCIEMFCEEKTVEENIREGKIRLSAQQIPMTIAESIPHFYDLEIARASFVNTNVSEGSRKQFVQIQVIHQDTTPSPDGSKIGLLFPPEMKSQAMTELYQLLDSISFSTLK